MQDEQARHAEEVAAVRRRQVRAGGGARDVQREKGAKNERDRVRQRDRETERERKRER